MKAKAICRGRHFCSVDERELHGQGSLPDQVSLIAEKLQLLKPHARGITTLLEAGDNEHYLLSTKLACCPRA